MGIAFASEAGDERRETWSLSARGSRSSCSVSGTSTIEWFVCWGSRWQSCWRSCLRSCWLRVLRVLAVPVLVGAIVVVVGWLLFGPLLSIPRFTTEGPVVRNGVAVIMACAKKSGFERMGAAMKYAPEPRMGT